MLTPDATDVGLVVIVTVVNGTKIKYFAIKFHLQVIRYKMLMTVVYNLLYQASEYMEQQQQQTRKNKQKQQQKTTTTYKQSKKTNPKQTTKKTKQNNNKYKNRIMQQHYC